MGGSKTDEQARGAALDDDEPDAPNPDMVRQHFCSSCPYATRSTKSLREHVKCVPDKRTPLLCAVCKSSFRFMKHYRAHIRTCRLVQLPTALQFELTDVSSATTEELPQGEEVSEPLNRRKNECQLINLCRELEGRHRCSKTAIDAVVQSVQSMIGCHHAQLETNSLKSDRARKKHYKQRDLYVPLKEVTLSSGSRAYVVPLTMLLENVLKHPEIAAYARKPLDPSNDGVLYDFKDGEQCIAHPVVQAHKTNMLLLNIYCDDVEIANALGAKRGNRGKLTLFYLTILNIPPHMRSNLSVTFLLGTGHVHDLKVNAMKVELLEDAVETLTALATSGIEFQTDKGRERFYGCVICFTGDALAASNIAGFKESFSPNVLRSCRRCMTVNEKISEYFYHSQCQLRTDEEVRRQVRALESATDQSERRILSRECGINGDSVLTRIPHFSLTKYVLFDPMHILLEGLIPKEVSLFLNVAVKVKRWFTRSQLNNALRLFNFHHSISTSDYPRMFETNLQLVASASGALIFCLHFPLILSDLLPAEPTKYLKSLVSLCQITQLCLSPIITLDTPGDLEEVVAEHQKLYISCYGAKALIAKHHMLIHLPEQIKNHGPARHHWTMRMEGKNCLSKSKKLFNYKNLPFSVGEYYQVNMSCALWEGSGKPRLLNSEAECSLTTGEPFILTSAFSAVGLQDHVGTTAISVAKIVIENVELRISDIMLIGSPCRSPVCVELERIVLHEQKSYFLCKIMCVESYSSAVNGFILKETSHKKENSSPSKKQLCKWSTSRELPQFSHVLTPLLQGAVRDKAEHQMLSRQLRHELVTFLNVNGLIEDASHSVRRWKYNDLGKCLSETYPDIIWETAKPGTRLKSKNANAWTILICRLSDARRVCKLRSKRRSAQTTSHVTSEGQLVEPSRPAEHTAESALIELKTVESVLEAGEDFDVERICVLLKASFHERVKNPYLVLPPYFLNEDVLSAEAELRFGASMEALEKKLVDHARLIAKVANLADVSYTTLDDYLRPRLASQALVAKSETPKDEQVVGPQLFWGSKALLVEARPLTMVNLAPTTTIEKGLILCLLIYFLKDLTYPSAFGQLLVLLQIVLKPAENFEPRWINLRLRNILQKLRLPQK